MSYVRCYASGIGEAASGRKGFVIYSDLLVVRLRTLIASFLRDTKLDRLIDEERVAVALDDLKQKRRTMVKMRARAKLGFHEEEQLDAGMQDLIDSDDFARHMHPMGHFMEAAVKAATGRTHPRPDVAIDERIWYRARRFIVEIPAETILIDQDEMEDDVVRIIATSRRPRSLSSIMNSLGRRDSAEETLLKEALLQFESQIRAVLADPDTRSAGRLEAATIVVMTAGHRYDTPSRTVAEAEEAAAAQICEAIRLRVTHRIQALWGDHARPPSVTLVSGQGQD